MDVASMVSGKIHCLVKLRRLWSPARIAGGWWVSFAHDHRVLAGQVRNDRGRLALGESNRAPQIIRLHLHRVQRVENGSSW